jgi:hypothetical protein
MVQGKEGFPEIFSGNPRSDKDVEAAVRSVKD